MNRRIYQALVQNWYETEATDKEAAPQHGEARPRTVEQQAARRRERTSERDEGEAVGDDLRTGRKKWTKDSRSERAAAGYTAAGHNQSTRDRTKEEQRNARRDERRTHEERTGRYTSDEHMAASLCGSEPHMAAHTTGTAHPAKRADEEHMRDDEDGGRRQRARRESDTKNMTEPDTAQPSARTSVEPSGTASISYRSRETIKISAEAKSRIIQKGNFHDIGIEKKRERDPG